MNTEARQIAENIVGLNYGSLSQAEVLPLARAYLELEARCAALEGAVVVAISHLPEYGGRTARKILTETLRATDNGGR